MKRMDLFLVVVAVAILGGCAGWMKDRPTAKDWFQKGADSERQMMLEEAVARYTEAIDLDEKYANAYFRRGMASLALQKSNAAEALADFNRAIKLDPENVEAYYQRALLNLYLLNNELAREDMKTAAALGHQGAKGWIEAQQIKKQKETAAEPTVVRQTVQTAAAPAVAGPVKEPGIFDLAELLPSHSEPVVHFDVNTAEIQAEDYGLLDEIALVLKERLPAAKVALAGHTDSTGPVKLNDALSLARAKAVETYFRETHNISAQRLVVRGWGEGMPVASNATEEGRAKNRRVEIIDARK